MKMLRNVAKPLCAGINSNSFLFFFNLFFFKEERRSRRGENLFEGNFCKMFLKINVQFISCLKGSEEPLNAKNLRRTVLKQLPKITLVFVEICSEP